jgi:hypothetical protein
MIKSNKIDPNYGNAFNGKTTIENKLKFNQTNYFKFSFSKKKEKKYKIYKFTSWYLGGQDKISFFKKKKKNFFKLKFYFN